MKQHNEKLARDLAKQVLKDLGYTYRNAAPALGVCYQHLAFVLNGQRESARLLQRIAALPPFTPEGDKPRRNSGKTRSRSAK